MVGGEKRQKKKRYGHFLVEKRGGRVRVDDNLVLPCSCSSYASSRGMLLGGSSDALVLGFHRFDEPLESGETLLLDESSVGFGAEDASRTNDGRRVTVARAG